MAATNAAQIKLTHQNAVTSGTYPYAAANATLAPSTINFTVSGTNAGSIDQTYNAQITATTSGASIQLNGGGLTDAVGDSISPVRIDAISVTVTGTSAVTMSGHFFASAFNAGTNYANTIGPGGYWSEASPALSAGMPCGTGSNSTLIFTTTNGTSTLLVAASGRSV